MSLISSALTAWSAGEIVNAVARGAVSALEVTEAYIRRIEEVNPGLNAVVVPLFARARADAAAVDAMNQRGEPLGAMAGLPFTVKESFEVAGTPATLGLKARANNLAASDFWHVARLRQAGAILLGKTNVSQLLMGNESANPVYGRTRNPWNLERSPGGSSGGEAAIVAAGGSALGLGTDIGGSLRLPAHACGIHSLKPTSRRLTMAGHASLFPGQEAILAQPGPMARNVADLELALRFLSTSDQPLADATIPPAAPLMAADKPIKGMRLALYTNNGVISAAPALRRAVLEAGKALSGGGAHVEEWKPPEAAEAWLAYLGILMADGSAAARRAAGMFSVTPGIRNIFLCGTLPRWFLAGLSAPILRVLGQRQLAGSMRAMGYISADRYWTLLEWRTGFQNRFLCASSKFDAIICPPDALPALRHGSGEYLASALSYSALYNLLGMPAGVVAATRVRREEETEREPGLDLVERQAMRCEVDSAGLPVGVQVVAPHWREDIVLSIMRFLEQHFKGSSEYPAQPPIKV